MGLALREIDREARAIEFYDLLSSFDFMASTPTLFNAGTLRPQLSSCFLTTVPDDLDGIFKAIKDNALLAKYAGGLGNDWTRVRGLGAHIKGTNGKSQGVVPFLKVANDTAVAVNQGGKRKGAVCAYLETWHLDIEEFLDLRKNTGDDRRRTHDMNTANWIPDLFMQRVEADGDWTLFSPDETPDLHDLFGTRFRGGLRGLRGQGRARRDQHLQEVQRRRSLAAHADHAVRDRPSLDHLQGSVQPALAAAAMSASCTPPTSAPRSRSTPPTTRSRSAISARSILRRIVSADGARPRTRLERTIRTAMRMLDNVIDINFYTIPEARRSNLRHRPVGLGIMGFQDACKILRLPYASEEAVASPTTSMEAICFYAISASVDLAAERGRYPVFEGSLWSKGILPIDSIRAAGRSARRRIGPRSLRLPSTGRRCASA